MALSFFVNYQVLFEKRCQGFKTVFHKMKVFGFSLGMWTRYKVVWINNGYFIVMCNKLSKLKSKKWYERAKVQSPINQNIWLNLQSMQISEGFIHRGKRPWSSQFQNIILSLSNNKWRFKFGVNEHCKCQNRATNN